MEGKCSNMLEEKMEELLPDDLDFLKEGVGSLTFQDSRCGGSGPGKRAESFE